MQKCYQINKYALLQGNSKRCKRIFGLEFELLEKLLKKVQFVFDQHKLENPISNRGIKSELGFENQFLLSLEYLKSYRSGEPSNLRGFGLFLWYK